MGQAKQDWMEAEERGWSRPSGFAYEDCVEDEYLKELVRREKSARKCSFCGRGGQGYIAAPVEALMVPIAEAAF